MKITVKLFGDLRRFLPQAERFKGCAIDIPQNTSLAQVLSKLPVPADTACMVIINDVKINANQFESTIISSDDDIVLLPPIKGG